jgi:hypothetical protein
MVPPHGACSEAMLSSLPAAGFDGACLSSGSLQAHNPASAWVRTLGYRPAEVIMGCPVLPRWALSADIGDVLVAAFLGRPIILRGHHGDLRDGAGALVRFARLINSLGTTRWSSVAGLMRSSYELTCAGTTAHVVPYAREIVLQVPRHVEHVEVHADAFAVGAALPRFVLHCANQQRLTISSGEPTKVQSDGPLLIALDECLPSIRHSPIFPLRALPVLRRLMTEARDRLMPLKANPFGRRGARSGT